MVVMRELRGSKVVLGVSWVVSLMWRSGRCSVQTWCRLQYSAHVKAAFRLPLRQGYLLSIVWLDCSAC